MLLTLSATSVRSLLSQQMAPPAKAKSSAATTPKPSMRLTDLPGFARQELGLYGLNISTDLLAGADFKLLDSIRDAADRASCPLLVLVEPEPQPLTVADDEAAEAAIDRMGRVVRAAHRLGCNAAAMYINGADTDEAFDDGVDRIKRILGPAERLEVNLLLSAGRTFTKNPERLTDLIKRIGGFRMGTFPDFLSAHETGDPSRYLRRLTPYASALTAVSMKFKAPKKAGAGAMPTHEPYDLAEFVKTIVAVGYSNTLAIEYRGPDDPIEGIRQTKMTLESALGRGESESASASAEGDAEVGDDDEDAEE